MTMIVNSKPLSEVFSRNNRNIYFSQEFQPYVKLENVLDNINLLTEENITVSYWPVAIKKGNFSSDIPEVVTTKIEVKEELFSEQFDDVAPEEPLSCNVDLGVSTKDNFAIKSETEDNNFELYSIQEHSDTNLVDDTRNCSTSQCIDHLLENNVTSTSLEKNSEDLSSLDLHLSTDYDTDHAQLNSEIECPVGFSKQKSIENSPDDFNLSQDTSSVCISDTPSSNRTPIGHNASPDMFEESLDINSQVNVQESTFKRTSTRCPSSSSDLSSMGDNREHQGEWNSQELSEVSQRLMLRSKQAKRLIMEVIRKRQMEEETLDAFKKRLRRM